jgi:hypothetical protein
VGAPGYLTAIARQTFGLSGAKTLFDNAMTLFGSYFSPNTQTSDTLQAAQAAAGVPLYRLNAAPAGASLDSVRAEVSTGSDIRSVTTRQSYQLSSGAWLELDQHYISPPDTSDNWGEARYDIEAQALSVAGQPAYLRQSLGWWTLDWKIGDDGLELRAPVSAISPENLIAAAGGVKP